MTWLARLIDEGILVRGGMTVGPIVRSWGQLYGPALIRAYELECDVARYPRIVVDECVFDELTRNPKLCLDDDQKAAIRRFVRTGADGVRYIDYLGVMTHDMSGEINEWLDFLRRHKDVIRGGILRFASNESPLQKYQWLRGYHNQSVTEIANSEPDSELRNYLRARFLVD